LLKALRKIRSGPQAILVDGQGIAHPRGLGIASHCGLALNLPTVGCAKSRLIGVHDELPQKAWSRRALRHEGNTLGAVLRSRAGVKPLYISPGHLIDIDGSVSLVKRCTGRYRLPEPTRQAHILVNKIRKSCGG
jgi:deoxyribonuclease V